MSVRTTTRTFGVYGSIRLATGEGGGCGCIADDTTCRLTPPAIATARSRLAFRRLLVSSAGTANSLHYNVQNGNKNKIEERRHDHATSHCRSDRVPRRLARAGGNDERQNTEDEGEGGHEDRT